MTDAGYEEIPTEWVDCYNCGGDGCIEGDCTCMDDTCCCLYPDPPDCSVCGGKGGWFQEDPADD